MNYALYLIVYGSKQRERKGNGKNVIIKFDAQHKSKCTVHTTYYTSRKMWSGTSFVYIFLIGFGDSLNCGQTTTKNVKNELQIGVSRQERKFKLYLHHIWTLYNVFVYMFSAKNRKHKVWKLFTYQIVNTRMLPLNEYYDIYFCN